MKPQRRWDFMHRPIFVSPDLIILTRLASIPPALQLWDISRKKLLTRGMDVLLRLWAGENVPKYNFTETEMLWQESCGCGKGSSRDARAHLKDQIMYSVESRRIR